MMKKELTYGLNNEKFYAKIGRKKVAILKYRIENDAIHLILTYTLRKFRGKGIASKLVKYAISYAIEKKIRVLKVSCSYVKYWLEKHPEYIEKFHKIIYEQ